MRNDLADAADADVDEQDGLRLFSDAMEAVEAQARGPQQPIFRPVGTRRARAETPDLCSPAGAQLLATRLREFWARSGFQIKLTVYPVAHGTEDRRSVMAIKSDLVGGLPPREETQ